MSTKRILANKINTLDKSILLIGPRQTGKSTLISGLNPDLEINFSDQETYIRYLSDPGLLRKETQKYNRVFIDEVQRIPSVLNTVQSILDKNKSKQFYLTGSSARKLKRGQANLLPGRILGYKLGPLTHQELELEFDVYKALEIGLLPGIYNEKNRAVAQKTLKTYSAVYLQEEIQAEALTRNLEGFSRFFQIIASRSGDFTDFAKFSALAMIERTTSRRYFDVLCDTLILQSIEAFTKSSKRRLVQHPRYYFFDVGVLNGSLAQFNVTSDRIGNLFEHLFLQLLIASAQAHDDDIRVSVFRTDSGTEVDFIVEKNNELFAVEVKATKSIGSHDLRGLKSFSEFYGKNHTSMIAYLGEESYEVENIQILPLLKALRLLGY
jgi:predicted AAA+ superfamily ATPase